MEPTEQEKIRLLEPYSKMTLPELYEAFCSNPDLRKKLGWQGNIGTVAYVWLDFAQYIRELFPASPLQALKDIKWLEVEFISKDIMADVLRKTIITIPVKQPITLKEFMKIACQNRNGQKLTKNELTRFVKLLSRENKHNIKLPLIKRKYRRGQSHYFDPKELYTNWEKYRKALPQLPSLAKNIIQSGISGKSAHTL